MTFDASLMSISTLSELLHEGQSAFLCYDLGRRVQPISTNVFQAVEQQRTPYPYPVQGHACFALVFWPQLATSEQDPYLWFLKFPLDERGLLEASHVQQFITSVITLLGQQVTHALTPEQEQQIQQSPYLFTPIEAKRAALHAQLAQVWQRPASVHYELALTALQQPEHWQQVGVQGLHDVAARLAEQTQVCDAIATQFLTYPQPLRQALAAALEHQQLPPGLAQSLGRQLQQCDADAARVDLLRSVAGGIDNAEVVAGIQHILQQPSQDEVIVCTARLWDAFDPVRQHAVPLQQLLDAMAQLPADYFAGLLSDLLRLPMLRPHLLSTLQRDDLPQQIKAAWQHFTGVATHAQ
ncbi:DUF3549 domain-containing protein [Pseudidiomarina sediminum]|uniref:DUF3549 domain-containing protein n=2 Tax=Pseudidiomarina sediminum TaxID=431675 RepID=A0A432Z859_9GAMM|nr:DUF3549 domain-containing protein [Pseudidiomarina sediminum]